METNRRDFLKAIGAGVVGTAMLGFDSQKVIKIGDKYEVRNGIVSQISQKTGRIKVGVMTDLHAHWENAQYFAKKLNRENVDVFLLCGDSSHSFGDSAGNLDDFSEILSVIEPVANTGKLVLDCPGNHEQTETRKSALKHLMSNYDNVVDMEKIPVADLDGLTIVALGGNVNPNFCVNKGYLRREEDFERLGELAKYHQTDKPLLIATHVPPLYKTDRGLDLIEDKRKHVGSEWLAKMRKAIDSKFHVFGHIHEYPGLLTENEEPIGQGEWVSHLDFKPGAVYDYLKRYSLESSAGIMEFEGNKARAWILNK